MEMGRKIQSHANHSERKEAIKPSFPNDEITQSKSLEHQKSSSMEKFSIKASQSACIV